MAPSLAQRVTAFLLVACYARADLSVHCVRHQLMGEWEFTLGPPSSKRSSCGHQKPDKEDMQPPLSLVGQSTTTKKIVLASPAHASTDKDTSGTWTMVYDEGFEIRVEGLTLFAFSKFDLWQEAGEKKNQSHCDATQLGWYHTMDRTSFGCYYGKLVSPTPGAADLVQVGETPQAAPAGKSASYDTPLSEQDHQEVVDGLNFLQLGWTAQVYDRLVGRTRRELNGMAGIRRPMRAPEVSLPHQAEAPALLEVRSRLRRGPAGGKLAVQESKPEKPLPAALDWRQAGGLNFLEPVIDQGDCGSCYTVATMRMLSARNKVRANDTSLLPFSISFPLYCAEYNQGCDGGYAFLATKWSADVGMVPATCAKYDTDNGGCKIDPGCAMDVGSRFRADNHRYVGGFYGGASEKEMMRELHEGGPLVVSLEPKDDLMYYKGGVYKSGPDRQTEWERVDHAVLLVGYGEEKGQKYWILQNSWGSDWGEDGFFRMARGINDSGVESIAVAADVVEDQHPEILDQFLASLG